jgi:hypothetical protein
MPKSELKFGPAFFLKPKGFWFLLFACSSGYVGSLVRGLIVAFLVEPEVGRIVMPKPDKISLSSGL